MVTVEIIDTEVGVSLTTILVDVATNTADMQLEVTQEQANLDVSAAATIYVTGAIRDYNEVPSGSINGSNDTFNISRDFDPDSVTVTLNGLNLRYGFDYYLSGLRTVIFYISPLSGDVVLISYNRG